MPKSGRDSKNSKPKIGRPKTTGPGRAQIVRMHGRQIDSIDAWIDMQDGEMSRPEAIRRLVELGLKRSRRLRAQELATKTIEKIIDPTALPEFREDRPAEVARFKRMEAAWLALAEEQDWLDGERSPVDASARRR